MDTQSNLTESVLKKLKTEYELIPDRNIGIDFSMFSLFEKGDNFKINYKWKVDTDKEPIFIISYNNSYRLNIVKSGLEPKIHSNDFRYFSFYCFLGINIPDLIIKPSTLADKVSNLFLNFDIKLNNRTKFNRKYILESTSNKLIDRILNEKITNLFEHSSDLIMEINCGHCLIWNLKPCNYENSKLMILILKELQETKNAAQYHT
jgi:hypothetical protein